MAELVHDLAPGAKIAFASAFWGQVAFGNAIRDLACLNRVETLPWDEWGRMEASYQGRTGADYDALLAATRALDRVLLWGNYTVPQYHSRGFRLAYWDRFARVDRPVRAGFVFDAWWLDPARATATDAARRAGQ